MNPFTTAENPEYHRHTLVVSELWFWADKMDKMDIFDGQNGDCYRP